MLACKNSGFEDTVPKDRTVQELLVTQTKYSTFLAAIQKAGLNDLLQGTKPLTFFVPTNEAFAAVDYNSLPVNKLKSILSYHIIDGNKRLGELPNGFNNTLANMPVWLNRTINATTAQATRLDLNNLRLTTPFLLTNIYAKNAFINEINFLINAPTGNAWQFIQNDPELQVLEEAIIRVNLQTALQSTNPITIFAPTNTAFSTVNLKNLTDAQLTDILKYHVLGGSQPQYLKDLTALTATANLATLLTGKNLSVVRPGAVKINRTVNVLKPDLIVDNGVIHKIDQVLTF